MRQLIIAILFVVLAISSRAVQPTTAFTYQGSLTLDGVPANGLYDFQCTLYADATNATPVSSALLIKTVPVTNGLFMLSLDFDPQLFNGQPLYLGLEVKSSEDGKFIEIAPRQWLTAAPYSVFSATANKSQTADFASSALAASSVPANGIGAGTANINITGRAASATSATFAGWATNLLGILPDSQFSTNIARLGSANLFSGTETFDGIVLATNTGNQICGSFFGNGAGVTNVSVNSLVATPVTFPVVAWGNNVDGETNVPTTLTNDVLGVAVGGYHSLAVQNDGRVAAWGYNKDGQINVPAGLNDAVAVAAGLYYSLALKSSGIVIGWGNNSSGQSTPPPGLTNVIAIAAGEDHSLALTGGSVVGWGNNANGQTNIPSSLKQVTTAIAAGQHHSLALKNDGTVVAWGLNSSGQINVPAGLTNVVKIATGYSHNLALKNDGTVVAWGDNSSGESTVPAGLKDVTGIAAGVHFSLALKSDGTIVAWGNNSYGQTAIAGTLSHISALAPGSSAFHSLAIRKKFTSQLVAMLDWDNTFKGSQQINGAVGINTSNLFENALLINTNTYLFSHPLFLGGENGPDHSAGLAIATPENFQGGAIGVPVLWGGGGGMLGVRSAYGDNVILQWGSGFVFINGNLNVNGIINGLSDRNAKQDFENIVPTEVLDKVLGLPITTWSYQTAPETRHIGPMAQDFFAKFAVGTDERHIASLDEDGVALAAIQGLNEKLEAENGKLKAQLAELKSAVQQLQQALQK